VSAPPRGRQLGLPFPGTPGQYNAITDVAGIEVGTVTLVSGEGPLVRGIGPVRTGVTAILPRGRAGSAGCTAGYYALNGDGEMTGAAWIEECGELQTPITITNTHSCGVTRDATLRWIVERGIDTGDIEGFHVTAEHAIAALDGARGGPVELGSVGGGTGMICYDFKGGNGSASRIVSVAGERYTLGVFLQANFGAREQLTVLGVPVGRHITRDKLRFADAGSVIVIVATDAPLLAHQLKRIARRVPLGLARTGTVAHNASGDIFLAFSTANEVALARRDAGPRALSFLPNTSLDPLFTATVEAVEESVIDAMLVNQTMVGRDGNRSIALPHHELLELMERAGMLVPRAV